ncbi:MAG: glycosyl transferase family 2 [Planctomycetota bacterium]|nr:MAG: glycosyl transferase family 2 [Planctomycetota bacterium]
MTSLDVSAVIALLDEAPDLGEIIRQYGAEFSDRGLAYEFILVLDGLGEELTDRVREQIPEGAPVRLAHFNQPFGEERALAVGYRNARGRMIVSLPSYMQLDPGDIHHVIDALESGYDLVAGWRVPRVDPVLNRLQSWLYNRAMSALTGVRLHDLNCGLTGLRRSLVDEVLVEGNVSRFLPVLAHRQGFKVGEVRVRHLREKGRQGFFGLGVYVRRVLDVVALLFITRFTRKPLRFFGMAGGLFIAAGLSVCAWLLIDYLMDPDTVQQELRNRASLVIGMSLLVLGVQIFALGLVGEIIIFTSAQNVRDYTVDRAFPARAGDSSAASAGNEAQLDEADPTAIAHEDTPQASTQDSRGERPA